MWNWIKRFFSGGDPPDILNFNDIAQIIKGVADYADYTAALLTADIAGNWNAEQNQLALQLFWINVNYYVLNNRITSTANDIYQWTSVQIGSVRNQINSVYWAGVARDAGLQLQIDFIPPNIERWSLLTIFGPLRSIIDGAVKFFLEHIGPIEALLFAPERLIVYLAKALWGLWVKFLVQSSGAIGRWLLHSMLNETSTFADIFERIIAALL